MTTTDDRPAVVPPCPAWCTLEPTQHQWDRDAGSYIRSHDAYAGTTHLAWLSCDEHSDGIGGPVRLTPPVLYAESDFRYGRVTPAIFEPLQPSASRSLRCTNSSRPEPPPGSVSPRRATASVWTMTRRSNVASTRRGADYGSMRNACVS